MPLLVKPLHRAVSIAATAALTLSGMVATSMGAAADTPAPGGTLDTAFNSNIGGAHFTGATAVAFDHAGGTIVATATTNDDAQDYPTHQLGRIKPDGTLDRDFDDNVRETGLFSVNQQCGACIFGIGVDNNGKVVVASRNVPGMLVRLNIDGTVDATLSGGKTFNEAMVDTYTTWGAIFGYDSTMQSFPMLRGLYFDSSNNIYVPGVDYRPVVKIGADGSYDNTWFLNFIQAEQCAGGAWPWLTAWTMDSSGRVIVAGTCSGQSFIKRMNTDGTIDGAFAPSAANFPPDRWGNPRSISALAVLDGSDADTAPGDGDIIAGYTDNDGTLVSRFAVADGARDSAFAAKMTLWRSARTDLLPSSNYVAQFAVDNGNNVYLALRTGWDTGGRLYRVDLDAADFTDATFDAKVKKGSWALAEAFSGPAFAVRGDGSGVSGSTFQFADGGGGAGLVAWGTDGAVDVDWTWNASQKTSSDVSDVTVIPDPADPTSDKWIVTVERTGTLMRFNMDGTVDKTFGGVGRVMPEWAKTGWDYQESRVAHDAEGNLYYYGQKLISDAWVNNNFAGVIKLGADGSQDLTFAGGDGYFPGYVSQFVNEPSGSLLLAGYFNGPSTGLRRISTSGADDLDFAYNVNNSLPYGFGAAAATAVLSDGRILAVSNDYSSMVMLNADGTLAGSWGEDGESASFTPDGANTSWPRSILTVSDGSFYVAGVALINGYWDAFITKFHPDGTRDDSYNANAASVTSSIEDADASDAGFTLDASGQVVFSIGDRLYDAGLDAYVPAGTLHRLNADGTQDTNFSSAFGITTFKSARLATQRDGKILAYGAFVTEGLHHLLRVESTLPEAPGNPVALTGDTGSKGGTVVLHVDPAITGGVASEYYVRFRLHGSTDEWQTYVSAIPLVGPSILISGLEGGELYDFEVAGRNVTGMSQYVGTSDPVVAGYVPLWSSVAGGASNITGGSAVTTTVSSVAPDGSVYSVGTWTTLGSTTIDRIGHWDGTAWLAMGSGITGSINTIFASQDEHVYIGGDFLLPGATDNSNIAQWNGTEWVDVPGLSGTVMSLSGDKSGHLFAGGDFQSPVSDYFATWDGASWADTGLGLDAPVRVVSWYQDFGTIVAGDFTNASDTNCGTLLVYRERSSYDCWGDGSERTGTVTGATLVDSHKIAVTGLTLADGVQLHGLGYFDSYTYEWTALGDRLTVGVSGQATINAVAGAGQLLYIGGDFDTADGVATSKSIVKFDFGTGESGEFQHMGGGVDSGSVDSLSVDDYGNAYVGGTFGLVYKDVARARAVAGTARVARFGMPLVAPDAPTVSADTGSDPGSVTLTVSPGPGDGTTPTRYRIEFQKPGDGDTWTTYAVDAPFYGPTVTVQGLDGNTLYVFRAKAQNQGGLSGWSAVTDPVLSSAVPSWRAMAGGMTSGTAVYALDAHNNGKVYVGGDFSAMGGVAASNVAVWDVLADEWSPLGQGLNGTVRAVFFKDGKLYAGGDFTDVGGVDTGRTLAGTIQHVAVWDGKSWSQVGKGVFDGTVYTISQGNDGTIYFGGSFDYAVGADDSHVAPALAAFDGTNFYEPQHAYMTVDNTVRAIFNQKRENGTDCYGDTDMLIAGDFGGLNWSEHEMWRGPGFARYDGSSWSDWVVNGYSTSDPARGVSAYACTTATGTGDNFGWGSSPGHTAYNNSGGSIYTFGDFLGSQDATYATWMNSKFVYFTGSIAGTASRPLRNIMMGSVAATDSSDYGQNFQNKIDNGQYPFLPLGGGLDGAGQVIAEDGDGNIFVGGEFANAYAPNGDPIADTAGVAMFGSAVAPPGQPYFYTNDGEEPGSAVFQLDGSDDGGPASYYVVKYRKAGTADEFVEYTLGAPFTSAPFTVKGMEGNTEYEFEVYAANSGGLSAPWTGSYTTGDVPVWSSMGGGGATSGTVYALDAHRTGHVYAGGSFTSMGGSAASNIAEWNRDLNTWSPLGAGLNGTVRALYYDTAADLLYAGGEFTDLGGADAGSYQHVAVWDGTSWSAISGGVDDTVFAIAKDGGSGHIYFGGAFDTALTSSDPLDSPALVGWDGSGWVSGAGAMFGTSKIVYSIADSQECGMTMILAGTEQGGESVSMYSEYYGPQQLHYWGGTSNTVLGVASQGCDFALASTGYVGYYDLAGAGYWFDDDGDWLDIGRTQFAPGDQSRAVLMDANFAYFTGDITGTAAHRVHNIARMPLMNYDLLYDTYWSSDPFLMQSVGGGLDGTGHALAQDSDGNLYVGGAFDKAYDALGNAVANTAGVAVFGAPIAAPGTPSITDVTAGDDAGSAVITVQAGGGGTPSYYTVRYCIYGTQDCTDYTVGAPFTGPQITVTGLTEGTDYVFEITAVNGVGNSDPVTTEFTVPFAPEWASMGGGVTIGTGVYALDAHHSGVVYAGGDFSQIGGVEASNVAVWNTVTDEWSALGEGLNGTVRALFYRDGKLYAGGDFTDVGGADSNAISHVAVWDGTAWSQMGGGVFDGTVYAISQTNNGTIYVGGSFDYAVYGDNEHTAPALAAFNGTDFVYADVKLETSETVTSLFNQQRENGTSNRDMIVAGDFSNISDWMSGNYRAAGLGVFNGSQWGELYVRWNWNNSPTRGISAYENDFALGTGLTFAERDWPYEVTGGTGYFNRAAYDFMRLGAFLGESDSTNATWLDSDFAYFTGSLAGTAEHPLNNIMRARVTSNVDGYGAQFQSKYAAGAYPFASLGGGLNGVGQVLTQDSDGTLYVGGDFTKAFNTSEVTGTAGVARWGAPPPSPAVDVTLASSTPADGASSVSPSANVVLTFSENIAWGSGSIFIKRTSDGSTVQEFTTADGGVSTNLLTLDPTSDLDWNTSYYVTVDSDAVVSATTAGTYAGIADAVTLDFTTAAQPSISWSPVTFSEAVANDGSVSTTSTGTLSGDTFTGAVGDDWSDCVTNVPAGLTAVLTRTDSTHLALSFTGKATSHASSDDVSDLTVTLAASDFTSGLAASGATTSDLIVDFNDPDSAVSLTSVSPTDTATGVAINSDIVLTFGQDIAWGIGSITLYDAEDNLVQSFSVSDQYWAGIISGNVLTLNPDSYLGPNSQYYVVVGANAIALASDSEITYTGLADPWDYSFTTGATPSLTWSSDTVTEAVDNDGSITEKLTLTATGVTFSEDVIGAYVDSAAVGSGFSNVPAGLTARFEVKSSTTGELSFSGTAASHAAVNSVSNLGFLLNEHTFGLTTRTFGSFLTSEVSGRGTSALKITFNDPAVAETPVTLVSSVPADGATGVDPSGDIVLTFSEGIAWGEGGVYLKKSSDDSTVASFTSGSAAGLATIATNLLTLDPAADLDWGMGYYLSIDSDAIASSSTAGTYAGIADAVTLDFTTAAQPSISWSPVTFSEAVANDGSVSTTSTGTLSGDTFTGAVGDDWSALVSNVPAGLTAVLTRTGATTVTLAFTGNASSHADADDVSDLSVVFTDDEFDSGLASSVSGSSTTDLAIDFADPAPGVPAALSYSSSTLFESAANDGAVGTEVTITLSGDTFTGSDGDDWSDLVGNVPDGLSAVLTRVDSTHLSLSLDGNAVNHADADSISDLTVALGDGEFAGGDAAGVTGSTRSLVVDFADPGMPTGTAIKVEVKVSIGSRLNDSDAELTGNGLMPDAEYTFEMHSTVVTLASGRTDALGAIHATVTLPPGVCVEPGVHELILTSTGPDGTPVQAVTYVTLGGSCTVWSKSAVTVTQLVVDDILFPFRTARLDKKAQKRLRALAPLLRGAEGIVIYGYTQTNLRDDSKTLKLINKRLGKQRARAVADYLRARGVNVQIKVLGRGAVLPKRKSAKYQWMNRRASIVARFPAPTPG